MAEEQLPRRLSFTEDEAIALHASGRPGKLETRVSKPLTTARDLSLAYSPGVAVPCLRIAENPDLAWDYTTRGNMVAVISNGTAVLGLGNIGALAGKPVMEGKVALFKRFADVDGIDLEVDTENVDEFVNCVRFLGPSFGGINLEDIKAPECFIIESRLREMMDIPVFHDDQHGTAIVAAAGFVNACHLTGRELADTTLVVNGAGAAGIACVELLLTMGLRKENVFLCDTKGIIHKGRTDPEPVEVGACGGDHQAHADGCGRWRGRVLRPVGQGRADPRHGALDGAQADHLRDGQPRSRDHAGGGARRQPRRDHRHGPLGLSEPGQQRAGLSLHLLRRARRARQHDQRGDEGGGGRGPGETRPRGRARRGAPREPAQSAFRSRIHHPERVRPAPDHAHPAGGGRSPRCAPASPAGRSPTCANTPARSARASTPRATRSTC